MSDTPQTLIGRQLKANYLERLASLRSIAFSFDKDAFDPKAYQDEMAMEVLRLKESVTAISQSGCLEVITRLGNLNKELTSLVSSVDFIQARNVLIDAVTDHFQVGQDFLENCRSSDPQVRLKMLRGALLQSDAPENLAKIQSNQLSGNASVSEMLNTCMIVLELCSPPYKDIDAPQLIVNFAELNYILADDYEERLPMVVEFVAANMRIFTPVVNHFLDFAIFEPDKLDRRLVAFRLGLDAQLLLCLYELTQEPVVKDLAEFTMGRPKSSMAYTYFDRMGVSRSAEWHFQEQEETTDAMQRARLYEYAVMTPGFEVNPSVIEPMTEAAVKECVAALKSVPVDGPDAARKRQMVFDVLVNEAKIDQTGKIKRLLAGADLPIELYKPHLNLLGERFGSDMNL